MVSLSRTHLPLSRLINYFPECLSPVGLLADTFISRSTVYSGFGVAKQFNLGMLGAEPGSSLYSNNAVMIAPCVNPPILRIES